MTDQATTDRTGEQSGYPGENDPNRMAGTDPAGRIDRLSLEQALKDFEIANARVLDLTQRLIDVTEDNRNLRTELELLRIEHRGLQIDHHAIVASRTYLLARIVQRVVNLVRT